MEWLRAAVRPIVTLTLTVGYVVGAGYLIIESTKAGDLEAAIKTFATYSAPYLLILGYYFGDRSARKALSNP